MTALSWVPLLVAVVAVVTGTHALQIVQTYRDIYGQQFQAVARDPITGTLVAMATEDVTKLDQDLSLVQTAKLTSVSSPSFKALAIDHLSKSVVVCQSANSSCEIRSINDLDIVLSSSNTPLNVPSVLLVTNTPHQIHVASNIRKSASVDPAPSMLGLSSRKVDNLDLVYSDKKGFSGKLVRQDDLAADYNVQYLYSFSHGSFVYHVSQTQGKARIGRICLDDKYYRSYVEIGLSCRSKELFSEARAVNFDPFMDKLFVGFTDGATTAVCAFDMKMLNKRLTGAVRHCYKGKGKLGPLHYHQTTHCVPTEVPVDLCGESEGAMLHPSISSTATLTHVPMVTLQNTVITALTTSFEDPTMVLYIGTQTGTVEKVLVTSDYNKTVVSSVVLDPGHPVMTPMFLEDGGHFLYAATQSKIVRLSVDHCAEKTSCHDCTSPKNLQCGWCVMDNRCSRESECSFMGVLPSWLPAAVGACAAMTDITPGRLSYEHIEDRSTQQISFKLDHLSLLDPANVDLHCSFVYMGTKHTTLAMVAEGRVTCPLPPVGTLPKIPKGVDHRSLEVEFEVLGRTVVKREVAMYDCRANDNCVSCTNSTNSCKWCHVRGMCVEGDQATCPDQTAPAISSTSKCPRLESSAHDTDILVHSGREKQITVRVANIQPDQMTNIHCLFTYNGNVTATSGKIQSSNLYCDPVTFSFSSKDIPIVTATFSVSTGAKSIILDNPQNIKVRIYKCGPMVTNCGQCLGMDAEYACGWCNTGTPHCSLETNCPTANIWLDRSATCSNPQILRFNPMAGPIQGKTNISVTGINLGKSYQDLEVTVAGIPCMVQPPHHESSQSFICETQGPSKPTEGVITVKVNNQYTTTSDNKFMFVEPTVKSLSPKQGPVSGGTTITIKGEYMNAGTMTTVQVGGLSCNVIRTNMTSLECTTPQQAAPENEVFVQVRFGNLPKLLQDKFVYVSDPNITMVEPKTAILSGGTTLTAIGSHLNLIQQPRLFIEHPSGPIFSSCRHQSLTSWLVCNTPKVTFPGENITGTNPREVHYGFVLDGVSTFTNISADPNFGPLMYYPDPAVEEFKQKYEKDHKLVMKFLGNLPYVTRLKENVNVIVGGVKCINPSATEDALSCEAPEQPTSVDRNGNAAVILEIGNMQKKVGYLTYFEPDEEEKPIAVGIILGVVLPIIAIIALLAICVIRRQRKYKPSENYIPDVWKDEGKKEEEEIGMNHVSVKADMNGSIPDDKDSQPYIDELLGKIDDDAIRHNVSQHLISRRKLDIGDVLGKGNFGVTYKATYSRSEEDVPTDVAAKNLQGNQTDPDSVANFLQRVTMYKDLQHPGIAPILGVCITVSDDPILVLPYAQNGDLKTHVRDTNRDLTILELLDYGQQIAEAMAYLESVHIVHGNLALRNCLLMDQKRVQVSDYGLTAELFTKDSYFKEDNEWRKLVKWTAPEAVETVTFTSQSDVWSFGVVLWELMTRGVNPYPEVESADLTDHLKAGNRLKKPKQCPEESYNLMRQCWSLEVESRPTFRVVADQIQSLTTTGSDEPTDSDVAPLKSNIEVGDSADFV